MKNSLIDVLFFIPIPVIFAAAVALYINNSEEPESLVSSISSTYNHLAYSANSTPANSASNPSDASSYQIYAMSEPFAANAPFENIPATWIQMMNNMMNVMQMTQMMHQMATMPMQVMNSAWINPHGLSSPSYTPSPARPMDPAEYKKWYEKQFEGMKMDEK